jgi:hypothetical protein
VRVCAERAADIGIDSTLIFGDLVYQLRHRADKKVNDREYCFVKQSGALKNVKRYVRLLPAVRHLEQQLPP